MRMIGRTSLFEFFKVGLVLAALQCVALNAHAEDSLKASNDAYLDQVVGVMRSHVLSMRMILDHDDLRYADNIVRHAEAFERARFGDDHSGRAETTSRNDDSGASWKRGIPRGRPFRQGV